MGLFIVSHMKYEPQESAKNAELLESSMAANVWTTKLERFRKRTLHVKHEQKVKEILHETRISIA